MSKRRKCFACEETTSKILDDFYLIGWNAISLDRTESTCACPKHSDKLMKYVMNKKLDAKSESQEINSQQVNPIIPDGQIKAENEPRIVSGQSSTPRNPAPADKLFSDQKETAEVEK